MALMSAFSLRRCSWQLLLAGAVALCSLSLMTALLLRPIEDIRNSTWYSLFFVVHASELLVFLNTIRREIIPRRRVAWSCVTISVLCGLGDFLTWMLHITTVVFDVGIFVFLILGLALYFPKKMWTIGNTWIILFESLVLAFSCVSIIQSLIYAIFGRTTISTTAASASVWVSFEFVALLGTLMLLYRYRHPVLIFAVLAALCLVLGDSISVAKRWLPGMYSTSGLTQWPLYFLQAMNMICFAYYSVERLPELDTEKLDRFQSNLIEWVYWTGLPVLFFCASLLLAFYVHAPDAWVVSVTVGVFVVRSLASTVEGFHLFKRAFGYAAELMRANAELRRRQHVEADFAAMQARTAMARDIHDSLGGHLHAATTLASSLVEFEGLPPRLQRLLGLLHTSITHAHREMRRAITVLNPAQQADAPDLPLEQALAAPVADAQQYGLPVVLTVQGASRPIPAATAGELVRVTQEALTNTRKYAQASEARVTVDYTDPAALILVIADNGVGMPTTPSVPHADGSGNGLGNMRARVEALGGQFVLPPVEQGVTLWMKLPL